MNLDEARAALAADPVTKNFLNRRFAATFDDFCRYLEEDLDAAINLLCENASQYHDKSEDHVTVCLVINLKVMGYAAAHDYFGSGHIDIHVESADGKWTWLGEAKWFDDVGDLREGFLQLVTRYRNRGHNLRGGLIAYCRRKDPPKHLASWKEHLLQQGDHTELSAADCPRSPLAFISTHKHASIGLPMAVRHVIAPFHFEPLDASGRHSRSTKAGTV